MGRKKCQRNGPRYFLCFSFQPQIFWSLVILWSFWRNYHSQHSLSAFPICFPLKCTWNLLLSRNIDLDILLYGTRCVLTSTLIIPHPQMQERDFVIGPLLEYVQPSSQSTLSAALLPLVRDHWLASKCVGDLLLIFFLSVAPPSLQHPTLFKSFEHLYNSLNQCTELIPVWVSSLAGQEGINPHLPSISLSPHLCSTALSASWSCCTNPSNKKPFSSASWWIS